MIELLFAALVDTAVAVVDPSTVYVHEWGAVTFTSEQVLLGTAPGDGAIHAPLLPDEWDEPVARAPVVYFYGAPFSGVFRVSVPSGSFLVAEPDPAILSDTRGMPFLPTSFMAEWRLSGDLEGPASALRESSCLECIGIPASLVESWRTPPAHPLQFDDGSAEKFVYYECSLTPEDDSSFRPVVMGSAGARLDPSYEGPTLRFSTDAAGELRAELTGGDATVVPVPLGEDGQAVVELLCDWAGGSMKSEELRALWDTWRDWVAEEAAGDHALLMFPFPASTVEGMTAIRLVPDGPLDVEYSRFFVGFVPEGPADVARIQEVNA